MATLTRRITRDKLSRVFRNADGRPNLEMIKAFESLLEDVGYLLPDELVAIRAAAESQAVSPALQEGHGLASQQLPGGQDAQVAALREEVAALRAEVRALQVTPI